MDGIAESDVLNLLTAVDDPELGVNIVDLGLVYGIDIDGNRVTVQMTMTSPACPLGAFIQEQAAEALAAGLPKDAEVGVDLVWSPPWGAHRMTDAARRRLGWDKI